MVELDEAEAWASEHRAQLLELLDDPSHDHGVGALLPTGQVLVAHVVGLVGELSSSNRNGNPWKHYKGRLKGGWVVALHTWLYHLGGGASAKLVPPTDTKNDSLQLVRHVEAEIQSHKRLRAEATYLRAVRVQRRQDTAAVDLELQNLYSIALRPFDWRLLRARGAQPEDPPPPQPTDAERSTAERDLRWLVACGASDPNSRLYALGGHDEILFMICELACVGGMAKWAPLRTARPQKAVILGEVGREVKRVL